jgi:hypothetical protein
MNQRNEFWVRTLGAMEGVTNGPAQRRRRYTMNQRTRAVLLLGTLAALVPIGASSGRRCIEHRW